MATSKMPRYLHVSLDRHQAHSLIIPVLFLVHDQQEGLQDVAFPPTPLRDHFQQSAHPRSEMRRDILRAAEIQRRVKTGHPFSDQPHGGGRSILRHKFFAVNHLRTHVKRSGGKELTLQDASSPFRVIDRRVGGQNLSESGSLVDIAFQPSQQNQLRPPTQSTTRKEIHLDNEISCLCFQ